ncbi:hypothetical protein M9458_013643, partial [Cirrhinus mrigala]
MSKAKEKTKSVSKPCFRVCVPPCSRYITSGDTHALCVACLGAEHAASALEGADCPHCERLPLRTLRSQKALFEEGAFTSVPRGSSPTSAEAERQLHSWGKTRGVLTNFRNAEGSPIRREAGCTPLFGVRFSPVPSGGRFANPASVSGVANTGASCRETVTGHHTSGSNNTRGQSREIGSLIRSFGSVEITAQCVCLGPAHCRGYRIQFGAPPPPFNGVSPTLVGPEQGLVMEQEVDALLRKEAIEVVPPHDRESGFYSRYFIVLKKDGGLHPILDLRLLNRSVMRQKFKMLTIKQVVSQIRSEDCFFYDRSKRRILPPLHPSSTQEVPEVCFQGRSIPVSGSSVRPSTLPRTFTKYVDAALAPLRLQGIRILNYIDDWLILAQLEQVAAQHRDVVLAHMKELGLRLNAKKSVLSPLQRTTYLGVVWDSTTMQARLSPARIESILTAVARVKEGWSLTVKQFQQLLGLMAAVSNVIPFGLLYMRPLQWWLKTESSSCSWASQHGSRHPVEFLQDRLSAGIGHICPQSCNVEK